VSGVLPLYGASPKIIVLTLGDTRALVNGNAIQLDVAPFIKESRTFIPLRFVSEHLGGEVTYDTKPDGTINTITVKTGAGDSVTGSGWKEIARWTGNNTKSTEKFSVPSEWRLTWSFDGTGHFSIVSYLGNGEYDKLVVNRIGPGSETNIFHQGGEFYLEITTSEAYTILIEGLY